MFERGGPVLSKIVKNESEGYGYKYSDLADLSEAGIDIPVMRTVYKDGTEYIEWLDGKGEWQQGARVVTTDLKGMNECQSYGAALSYARRYTVLLSQQVATRDDDEIEKAKPTKTAEKIDFKEVRLKIKSASSVDELMEIYNSVPDKLRQYFKDDLTKRKREVENG